MSNSDTLKGQWKQIKGQLREQWGRLSDDEIEQIRGSSQNLIGKLQERYGLARDEAEAQFARFMRNISERANRS